jgi:hypothetical protein
MAALTLVLAQAARADHCTEPGCDGPDVNRDCLVNISDLGVILANFGLSQAAPEQGDADNDQDVDITDLGLVLAAFGADCGELLDPNEPDPNEPDTSTADLTAHRPRHGPGYAPFVRTPVSDADEDSSTLGPGIRLNHPGDADPVAEDDLIEITLMISPADTDFVLRRENANLMVWTTPDKQGGSEIAFINDVTDALPFGAGLTTLTVWVEWAAASHGSADLHVERPVA